MPAEGVCSGGVQASKYVGGQFLGPSVRFQPSFPGVRNFWTAPVLGH